MELRSYDSWRIEFSEVQKEYKKGYLVYRSDVTVVKKFIFLSIHLAGALPTQEEMPTQERMTTQYETDV